MSEEMQQDEEVDFDAVFGDQFDTADSSGRASKVEEEGTFVVKIEKIKLQPSSNPQTKGHVYFVVNYVIEKSDNENLPPGRKKTWTNDLMNEFFGMANTKQFLAATCGIDPDSAEGKALTKEHLRQALKEEDLIGETVTLTTSRETAKTSGREFTKHTWTPNAA